MKKTIYIVLITKTVVFRQVSQILLLSVIGQAKIPKLTPLVDQMSYTSTFVRIDQLGLVLWIGWLIELNQNSASVIHLHYHSKRLMNA